MSVDPLIQSPTSTQSINPYSYIMNNPLAGTDPTGYAAEEIEKKIKVSVTGSHIKRTVTATAKSNGSGGVTITFSGGNGAARSAAMNAVAGKLSGQGFQVSNVGSLGDNAAKGGGKSWNNSEASEIADKYSDVSTPDTDSTIQAINSDQNDLGQTAGGNSRRASSSGSPLQPYVNLRYNELYNQIRAIDPQFSVVRPPGNNRTHNEVRQLEIQLGNMRGEMTPQPYWPINMGFSGRVENSYLRPGQIVDRYGREGGYFVSPSGTPFGQRSLPSEALSAPYSQYRILRPIHVRAGSIAPAFGQMGGGTQYILPLRVRTLIDRGYMERVNE